MNPKHARILKTIGELEDYLGKLNEACAYTFAEFQKDWNIYFSVERLIQLTVECVIEMGEDIIASARLKKPKTYRETFRILCEADIISTELSEQLEQLSEFRNKLVHAYATVLKEKIYDIYTESVEEYRNLSLRGAYPRRSNLIYGLNKRLLRFARNDKRHSSTLPHSR